MRSKILLRLSVYGAAAAAVMSVVAVPAHAASTQGAEMTSTGGCTEPTPDVTACTSLTERRIEVLTPAGIAVFRGEREYSDATSYPGGSYTIEGTRKYVYVYASSVAVPDGVIYFDPKVAKVGGSDVLSYSDGLTCNLETNFVEANGTGGYDHSTGSCTSG
ncbi:hypothetical protein J7E83_05110 [Arthrobacter sp. ISL-48]|uniref:hypothetical protein n=1 Tax=Arthrobacter sp. ISL-48 TaxID=2819110 RepID=UPI001BEBFBD1|nr:hypothetical protein [Arthrobacter sp. ISL-48]MBT2531517.1 hypothetical protein [Arthrobacter sp. ISL-48]